tara:strand:- start:21060 stop:21578 length:519 start_codon:yes stop_codon:yes gene_type:complete
MAVNLADYITDVPDYPKPGILFKDITPLLQNPEAFSQCIDNLSHHFAKSKFDVIVGIESRGFIFACPLAIKLKTSFVPIRKSGKLPRHTLQAEYELEYGSETVEIHEDAIPAGSKVLIVDDVLATGGTIKAAINLVEQSGASHIEVCTIVELLFLNGRDALSDVTLTTLVTF